MQRAFRLLPKLLLVTSVLVSVAAGVLWARASRGRADRWSFHLGGRVSVRCDPRRITLIAPPGRGSADDAAEARAMAARLRNGQARWIARFRGVTLNAHSELSCEGVRRETSVEGWSWVPATAAYRPLLEALEDPDRFVVAHHLLCQVKTPPGTLTPPAALTPPGIVPLPGMVMTPATLRPPATATLPGTLPPPAIQADRFVANDDGLHVQLESVISPQLTGSSAKAFTLVAPKPLVRLSGQEFTWSTSAIYAPGGAPVGLKDAHVDRADRTAVLDQWQDRLGVEVVRVPYWAAIAAGLVLPAGWTWRKARAARLRRRRGLCPHCGYDLRASPDRCPECGAACKAADPAGESPAAGD